MPSGTARMNQTVRFQEILRRLAIIDEAFVEDQAGLRLDPAGLSALDPKIVALLQLAVLVAIGSSEGSLQWSTGRALAAGATEEEIAEALLAIAPVAGLGRVATAAPGIATGLEYDIEAALIDPGSPPAHHAGRITAGPGNAEAR
jgi:alkylhydroperoxidase/carboxymuconolactone decarboxylase family protein YurZ